MSVKRGAQQVPVLTIEETRRGADPHKVDHGEISSTAQEEDRAGARKVTNDKDGGT